MSHFTCAVITDGTKTVEELMAPYQENNCETVPRKYLEFTDETDEYRDEYESGTFTYWRDPSDDDQTLVWEYADAFKTKVPDGYVMMAVPRRLVYPTFELYMADYYGMEPDESGRYGYWENPNARWDDYCEYGRGSWVVERVGDVPAKLSDLKFNPGKEEADALQFLATHPDDDLHRLERYWRMRGMTDEQFVEASRHLSFWACVTPDGEWHEGATMGWFGASDGDGDTFFDWQVHFAERFIEPYDGSCLLHVLDCHI